MNVWVCCSSFKRQCDGQDINISSACCRDTIYKLSKLPLLLTGVNHHYYSSTIVYHQVICLFGWSTYLLKKWIQTDICENVNPKFYQCFLNLNEFLFWEGPWKQKMKHLTPNNFQHHLEAYYGHHTLPKPIPVCIATCFDTYKFPA